MSKPLCPLELMLKLTLRMPATSFGGTATVHVPLSDFDLQSLEIAMLKKQLLELFASQKTNFTSQVLDLILENHQSNHVIKRVACSCIKLSSHTCVHADWPKHDPHGLSTFSKLQVNI